MIGGSAVMRAGMLTAAALLVATPTAAQERPLLLPQRDVAIVYRLAGGVSGAQEIETFWLAARSLQRFELGGGVSAWVLDHKDLGASFSISELMRTVVPVMTRPEHSADLPGMPHSLASSGRSTRVGEAVHVGLACTVWRFEGEKQNGESCITADGIVLRGHSTINGKTSLLEATRVNYEQQDPARFRPQTATGWY